MYTFRSVLTFPLFSFLFCFVFPWLLVGPLQDVRPWGARDGAQAVEGLLYHGGRCSISRGRAGQAAFPGGEEGAGRECARQILFCFQEARFLVMFNLV